MERIPILKMGDSLLVSIRVDMHDRLAMALQDDLTACIAETRAEDSAETILVYEKMLAGAGYQVIAACTLREARQALAFVRPRAIITELKRSPETHDIPIAIVSTVEDERKGLALGADAYCVKPVDRQTLLHTITRLVAPETVKRVLVVDDEEISRYVLRQQLATLGYVVAEAATGPEALRMARAERPDVICLDLFMPEVDGLDVLRGLKAEAATRDIPVVIVTSKVLAEAERRSLLEVAAAVLSKEAVSLEGAAAAVDEALRRAGRAA